MKYLMVLIVLCGVGWGREKPIVRHDVCYLRFFRTINEAYVSLPLEGGTMYVYATGLGTGSWTTVYWDSQLHASMEPKECKSIIELRPLVLAIPAELRNDTPFWIFLKKP